MPTTPLWPRLIKFVITGGVAFMIDAGLYFILTRYGHLHYLASRAISIGLSMSWNFTVNRYWTFQAQDGLVARQASRFVVVMTATSLASLLLMRVGVDYLRLNDLIVLVGVSILMMGVNYTAHQTWSYRN